MPQETLKEWMAMFAKPAPQQPALQQHDIPLFFKNILMSTPPAGFSTPRQLYLLAERKDVEEPLEVICEAYWQKIYRDGLGFSSVSFAFINTLIELTARGEKREKVQKSGRRRGGEHENKQKRTKQTCKLIIEKGEPETCSWKR